MSSKPESIERSSILAVYLRIEMLGICSCGDLRPCRYKCPVGESEITERNTSDICCIRYLFAVKSAWKSAANKMLTSYNWPHAQDFFDEAIQLL
jgi:hypothetical protein